MQDEQSKKWPRPDDIYAASVTLSEIEKDIKLMRKRNEYSQSLLKISKKKIKELNERVSKFFTDITNSGDLPVAFEDSCKICEEFY